MISPSQSEHNAGVSFDWLWIFNEAGNKNISFKTLQLFSACIADCCPQDTDSVDLHQCPLLLLHCQKVSWGQGTNCGVWHTPQPPPYTCQDGMEGHHHFYADTWNCFFILPLTWQTLIFSNWPNRFFLLFQVEIRMKEFTGFQHVF